MLDTSNFFGPSYFEVALVRFGFLTLTNGKSLPKYKKRVSVSYNYVINYVLHMFLALSYYSNTYACESHDSLCRAKFLNYVTKDNLGKLQFTTSLSLSPR